MRTFPFFLFLLFHLAGCGNVAAPLSLNNNDNNNQDISLSPDTIVALGDSITAGQSKPTYPSFLADLLATQGFTNIINAGEGGSTTKMGIEILAHYIITYNPSHILILYGVNDILGDVDAKTIIKNLKTMTEMAGNNGAIPVLATLTPVYGPSYPDEQPQIDVLNRQIRQWVQEEGIALADLAAYPWDETLFMDGIHPNNLGNQIIASLFFNALNRVR